MINEIEIYKNLVWRMSAGYLFADDALDMWDAKRNAGREATYHQKIHMPPWVPDLHLLNDVKTERATLPVAFFFMCPCREIARCVTRAWALNDGELKKKSAEKASTVTLWRCSCRQTDFYTRISD